MIATALAFLLPWVGRGLVRAGLDDRFSPMAALKAIIIVLALIPAGIGVWKIGRWVHGTYEARVELEQSKRRAAEDKAKALLQASTQKDDTLRDRDRQIGIVQSTIATLEKRNEELRRYAPDPDTIIFAADDPWLARDVPAARPGRRPVARPAAARPAAGRVQDDREGATARGRPVGIRP